MLSLTKQRQAMSTRSMWRQYRNVPAWILPQAWRTWVLDKGSLTKRLINASQGDFAVRVVFQGWAYPSLDEAEALGIPCRRKALIREVELLCFGEPWVQARSVIPNSTLTGQERQLRYLGNRPLGAFLFKSRTMRRKAIEVAALNAQGNIPVYGRRSVFLLHEKPLLVSELFLPSVLMARPKLRTQL